MKSNYSLTFSTLCACAVAATAADLCLDGCDSSGWDQKAWYTQVDGVMGGRSSGSLKFTDDGRTMDFTGVINLTGGGFSSVRRRFPTTLDLSSYAGVVVDFETDGDRTGSPLGLHLQLHDGNSYYGFASAFAVPLSEDVLEASAYLPLSSFDRGSSGGRRCRNCALDVTKINEMDVYVLFQDGPFSVRIKSVIAVRDARSFAPPPVDFPEETSVPDTLRTAIRDGGSLYDKSYPELCISIYWSVLNTIAASTNGVSDSTRQVICAGLAEANRRSDKAELAWTLRYTMDAVISDLEGAERSVNHDWLPEANNEKQGIGECAPRTSFAGGLRYSVDDSLNSPNEMVPLDNIVVQTKSDDSAPESADSAPESTYSTPESAGSLSLVNSNLLAIVVAALVYLL